MARPIQTSANVPEKARRFGACEPAAVGHDGPLTLPGRVVAKAANPVPE